MAHRRAAHRGGSGLHPENTLGAFRAAHERFDGVWLELDVRLSADDELVVIHDHTLDRTTSGTGLVSEKTAGELESFDASALWPDWDFEPVPSLGTVLREGLREGWRLLCEIKNIDGQPDFDPSGERAVQALLRALDRHSFPPERLEVISFSPATLDAVKHALPDVRVGFLSYGPVDNVGLCVDRGYHITAPFYQTIDAGAVEQAHDAGLDVYLWTVNHPDDITQVSSLGVDCIISDRPDLVR